MIRPARKRPDSLTTPSSFALDVESIPVVERDEQQLEHGVLERVLIITLKSRISATVRKKKMNVVGDAIGSSPRNIPTSDEASAKKATNAGRIKSDTRMP